MDRGSGSGRCGRLTMLLSTDMPAAPSVRAVPANGCAHRAVGVQHAASMRTSPVARRHACACRIGTWGSAAVD